MNKVLLYFLSFIFIISGTYFYTQFNTQENVIFSQEDINIISKEIQPMLVEDSGIEITYDSIDLNLLDHDITINLNFLVEGFSLSFNGKSKFNSKLIIKNNKLYLSDIEYSDFQLINVNENDDFSKVFVKQYTDFIKKKTKEELNDTLKISFIYDLDKEKYSSIKDYYINKRNLNININKDNSNYIIYSIISFILCIILFFVSFKLKPKNS
tara:strand:+ start:7085 stop:7717 length:633 start_codon:yes stop_codon:yes gene_type:complete